MGRIFGHGARRRALVGAMAIAGLALVACEPLKPPAPPEAAPELPQLCVPNGGGPPEARLAPAPAPGGDCTPICLPGQEPPPPPPADARAEPAAPACVPICIPGQEPAPAPAPEASRAEPRCVPIFPCLPDQGGVRMTPQAGCTNFCVPGQEPPPAAEVGTQVKRGCLPLCRLGELVPGGIPGFECPPSDVRPR